MYNVHMLPVYTARRGQTRQKILAASEWILRRGGAGHLTIRRVAARVRLTPMAIYRHFRSKDELIAALVAIGFDKWETRLESAISGITNRQMLRKAMLAYRDFALDEQRLFELMFLLRRAGIPVAPGSLQATPSPAFSQVIAAVRQCMSTGSLLPGDVAETILLVWSTSHGLITLHFSGRFGHDEKVFRNVFERTLDRQLQVLNGSYRQGR